MLVCALGLLLLCTACGNKDKQDDNSQALSEENEALREANEQKDAEIEALMTMMNQVRDGFDQINAAEGRIKDGNAEMSQETIAEQMAFIQQRMEENRSTIAQMKERMKNGSLKMESLSKNIEALEAQLNSQTKRIAELEEQLADRDRLLAEQSVKIEDLSANVSNLTTENEQQAATMAAQDAELNKAWYVCGTKKELKQQKILDGSEVMRSGDFNRSYFTQIDIRHTTHINLYSKKAKVLTNHPGSSYTLEKNADGQYELDIVEPGRFWSVSKYLVIRVD